VSHPEATAPDATAQQPPPAGYTTHEVYAFEVQLGDWLALWTCCGGRCDRIPMAALPAEQPARWLKVGSIRVAPGAEYEVAYSAAENGVGDAPDAHAGATDHKVVVARPIPVEPIPVGQAADEAGPLDLTDLGRALADARLALAAATRHCAGCDVEIAPLPGKARLCLDCREAVTFNQSDHLRRGLERLGVHHAGEPVDAAIAEIELLAGDLSGTRASLADALAIIGADEERADNPEARTSAAELRQQVDAHIAEMQARIAAVEHVYAAGYGLGALQGMQIQLQWLGRRLGDDAPLDQLAAQVGQPEGGADDA
jgi:hypothetical protein